MAHREESQGLFEAHGANIQYIGIGRKSAERSLRALSVDRLASCQVILNLGTCGSFDFSVGSLVQVDQYVDRSTKSETLYLPPAMDLALPRATCGSGDFLEQSRSTLWDVMDMEAWTIAQHCLKIQKPLLTVKFVTDNSTGDVFSDWKSQLPAASRALFEFFLRIEKSREL